MTIITYGSMTRESRQAAEKLAELDVQAEIIDLRTLTPLDSDTVLASVRSTHRAVVVHEAQRTGGFGAEVIARIQEQGLYSLEAPIERVTGWDIVVPLKRTERHHLPDADRIVRAALKTLEA